MRNQILTVSLVLFTAAFAQAQLSPAITCWIQNQNGTTARHYVKNNYTPISDTGQVNVQLVQYSTNNVYLNCSGLPAYVIGPYLDGNPSTATNRQWLFRIPLNPKQETGTQTATPLGQIGVLINGVPMYNYSDAMSYNNLGIWNRNAMYFENAGFDCAKGHPNPVFDGPPPNGKMIGASYHHHQNPTAFNLDKVVVSNVCDLYLADGLYKMDSTMHSPLLGYAFDGFPVYGAYGYKNSDGTGGIVRVRSSYQKRNITDRTTLPDGTQLSSNQYGPSINGTYPLGCYQEDFEYVAGLGDLDEHNGRFVVTPEYPKGIYAYFATVDENQNSAYPYFIGPTYYGKVDTTNFNNGPKGNSVVVNETVTRYAVATGINTPEINGIKVGIYPNPSGDFAALQLSQVIFSRVDIQVFDERGQLVQTTYIEQGSSMGYVDTRVLPAGIYWVKATAQGKELGTQKLVVAF